MRIKITITDDNGKTHEGEIELNPSDGKKTFAKSTSSDAKKTWYKKGSTTEKLLNLIGEGFFDKNRVIKDIIEEFKSKDYQFKSTGLTMYLRIIVRKELLKKTKNLPDGTKSKQWTYIKN